MSFIEGDSLGKIIGRRRKSPDATEDGIGGWREAVRRLAFATLRQVFEDGYFHADPHPGNILLGRHGEVGLVDFGIVGRMDESQRRWLRSTCKIS